MAVSIARSGGFASMTIGEIAANYPGATRIFRAHRLDYGCGGADRLDVAAARNGVDAALLEIELAALSPRAPPPPEPGALIDFILNRYHEAHRRQLPELVALARKLEALHAGHPEAPRGLAKFLVALGEALEDHMAKEEMILFPMIEAGHALAARPIAIMRAEHNGHGEALVALEMMTRGMRPPADASDSWRALYAGLATLADDLMDHIHVENNILFPNCLAPPSS